MPSALLIRLRPSGPWRIGPDSGDRDRVDRIYHSDAVYSAVTHAMLQLGMLDSWLEATARAEEPAVRFSSCFPFQDDTLFVVAPRSVWPPPASSKVRWKGARFVPLAVVDALLSGKGVTEENWTIDGASECLVPLSAANRPGPCRVSIRSRAAIDRSGAGETTHSTAALEFTPGSGLWMMAGFASDAASEQWKGPVTAALRLLADSGFGGERSGGWGRSEMPEIVEGEVSALLFRSRREASNSGYWLLSLFHPSDADQVDWKQGNYTSASRGGRIESSAGWGEAKAQTRMIAEGSVLVSGTELRGKATDVAPAGFAHPVYRSGFAFAVPVPYKADIVRPPS